MRSYYSKVFIMCFSIQKSHSRTLNPWPLNFLKVIMFAISRFSKSHTILSHFPFNIVQNNDLRSFQPGASRHAPDASCPTLDTSCPALLLYRCLSNWMVPRALGRTTSVFKLLNIKF